MKRFKFKDCKGKEVVVDGFKNYKLKHRPTGLFVAIDFIAQNIDRALMAKMALRATVNAYYAKLEKEESKIGMRTKK